ncbi:hypothetical protein ANCCAN_25801 [Ancylostoma caninum]|uniref:Uncharacterized protein n=1 Tax=Ancylostoma caninum TaxID=29170 RepID=A0A368FCA4_ANCCA|nr:hypothetical protein ANCCAN_25801 [Ancylostoma caninum]
MNLSWANQFAKTALKTAQQKIDSVLDIRPEDAVLSPLTEEGLGSESLVTTATQISEPDEVTAPTPSSSAVGEGWANAWNSLSSDRDLVVDSEPNPIRDECPQTAATLFDHSPSSNSSDGPDPGQSPQKSSDCEEIKRVSVVSHWV